MIPYKYSLEDFDFVVLSKQSRDPREKRLLLILADLQDERQADIAEDHRADGQACSAGF